MAQRNRRSGYQGIRFSIVLLLQLLVVCCQLSVAIDLPRFYGEEVVVTASRLPQLASRSPWNTTVISPAEVANYRTVGEVLRSVAGIDSQTYGYAGALTSTRLRGANASQVLVLVDGRRINSPTLGMFDLGDLTTDKVDKIEVVRAPLSAAYGSDAISGVINILTKTPQTTEKNISLVGGSFGTNQYKLSLAGQNYFISANYLKSDGFRLNSDCQATDLYGKMTWPTPLGELTADYGQYDAVKGVPGVPTSDADAYSASEPLDRQKDRNTMASVGLKNDDCFLRVYQNQLDQRLDPYLFGASSNLTRQTVVEWQQQLSCKDDGKLLYGLEVRQDYGRTTMSGEHNINNYAAFLQEEIELSDRLSLSASIRGDKHSTAGTSFNPRFGLAYQASQNTTLRASAGNAFRAPTLNELYWNDGWMFGNIGLRPEKSFSYELGIERQISQGSVAKLNYYVATVTDLILWDWQSSSTETRAKNVGEVGREGVEFEYVRSFGENGKGFVNYSYQRAVDNKDFDPLAVGKMINYAPQTKYNVGLVVGETTLVIRHVGERYADLYNTVKLPAYTVVDLKLAKALANYTLELAVDNLFGEKYSEAVGYDPLNYQVRNYPLPGRRFTLGLKWVII